MRKLSSLMGNSQRLDGGAMFGNAPRALWSRWVDIDAQHRIALCCRTLLVEEPGRRILFETGIGAYMTPKFRERFGVVESRHVLLDSLAERGLTHEDIDIVVLSHLHFDHAGGLLEAFEEGHTPQLLFPKARFLVHQRAWERCRQPHFRDRASFIPGLDDMLEATGRLVIVDLAHHEVDVLRSEHAHRRPGFDDAEVRAWLEDVKLEAAPTRTFAGAARVEETPLTVCLWAARG